MNNPIIIEENIRFSQSILWRDQKKYYEKKGIAAWSGEVPFYVTSNPSIGKMYAQMIIAFIQDYIAKNKTATQYPFYILELGAGAGKFSFYVLKNIAMMQKTLQLTSMDIRYVMTDSNADLFSFWETHPALHPFIDSHQLDFAVYDLLNTADITLHRSQKKISQTQNPLIVIANYVFDSVPCDVFTVRDGKLYESLAMVKAPHAIFDCCDAAITFQENLIQDTYYHNALDDVLFSYASQFKNTHFQFPIAALKALMHLQTLSQNRLLLLSSDKGYSCISEMENCNYPRLSFDGTFSMMVNLHAIGEYFKKCGGDCDINTFRESLITGIFASGFAFTDYPALRMMVDQTIHGYAPTDYFFIYQFFSTFYEKATLEMISGMLRLSDWDPNVFIIASKRILELASKGESSTLSFLADHLHRVAENFYFLPEEEDALFTIALFYHEIRDYEKAVLYYQQSLALFGECEPVLFNVGICLVELKRCDEALNAFQSALIDGYKHI